MLAPGGSGAAPLCHAAANLLLLLSLLAAALSLHSPHWLLAPALALSASPYQYLPPALLPPPPPPAAAAPPLPLPGPPALHALQRGATCAYLALTPTTKLELCPFARARLFASHGADWDRFSSLSTATPCGSYSAADSGEGPRQAFVGGAPCAAAAAAGQAAPPQHSATVDFVCDSQGGSGSGSGGGSSPLQRLRLVSASEPSPCAHEFVVATSLLCGAAAGGGQEGA
jgi:hypothetical protein